jgi:uncharacterized membrane protein
MRQVKDNLSATVFTIHRLEALADGVFAIAMTLLVLEISVPLITETSVNIELLRTLLEMWPKFFAYVVSFLVLGVMWGNHHFMFHCIKRTDSKLVWINILFLMFVALIPFSTSLLGEYRQTQVAVVVYGINIFLILSVGFILWLYIVGKRHLADNDIAPGIVKRRKMMYLIASLFTILAIGISFISPLASFGIYALMVVLSIVSSWAGTHGFLSMVPEIIGGKLAQGKHRKP